MDSVYMDLECLKNYAPSLKETNVHMLKKSKSILVCVYSIELATIVFFSSIVYEITEI